MDVGVDQYLAYHHFVSKVAPAIIQLHVKYRDADGDCIDTDDASNGNIQQFLFGDGIDKLIESNQLGPEMLSRLRSALGPRSADAAPNKVAKLLEPYRGFSQIETQIVPRPEDQDLCRLLRPVAGSQVTAVNFSMSTLLESRKVGPGEVGWQITVK